MIAIQEIKTKLESIEPALSKLDDQEAYYLAGYVACMVDIAKQGEKKPEKAN